MAAPKGNEFWKLRSKHGRDKLFATPELLWEAACEYFQWCIDNPLYESVQGRGGKAVKKEDGTYEWPPEVVQMPKMRAFTLQGLCLYMHCNTKYFNDFDDGLKDKTDDVSKGFSEIVSCIRETIYQQKFEGAAAGFLNPNIIARDLGLAERKEIAGTPGGAPIPISGGITHNIIFTDAGDGAADQS